MLYVDAVQGPIQLYGLTDVSTGIYNHSHGSI